MKNGYRLRVDWEESSRSRLNVSLTTSSIVPMTGLCMDVKTFGGLMVLIAAKARMRALGNASASLFAAPRSVAPLVTTSSTRTISSGSGNTFCATIDSKCCFAFGLFGAKLVADFGNAVTLSRQGSTILPSPFCTKAFASRCGTQSVPDLINELFGVGIKRGFFSKIRANGNTVISLFINSATYSDIRDGGLDGTTWSSLRALITVLELFSLSEVPRGE